MAVPPRITNVTYTNTHPNLERAGAIAAEYALFNPIEANLSANTAAKTIVGLEIMNFRDVAAQTIQHGTANMNTNYSDGSKTVMNHNGVIGITTNQYTPQGTLAHKVNTSSSGMMHTRYNNNTPYSTTFYPSSGGIYKYDGKGNYQGSSCTIS